MTVTWLMLSMLYSTVGLGMFIYGKKQVHFVPLLAGLALMIVPFFLTSSLWMSVVCVPLMLSPFALGHLERF